MVAAAIGPSPSDDGLRFLPVPSETTSKSLCPGLPVFRVGMLATLGPEILDMAGDGTGSLGVIDLVLLKDVFNMRVEVLDLDRVGTLQVFHHVVKNFVRFRPGEVLDLELT